MFYQIENSKSLKPEEDFLMNSLAIKTCHILGKTQSMLQTTNKNYNQYNKGIYEFLHEDVPLFHKGLGYISNLDI